MKQTALTIVILAAPALLAAQQSSNASASSSTSAHGSAQVSARANAQADVDVPATYSTYARERIASSFRAAHAKNVPDDQMRKRMAEGQARGATDVEVASAIQRTETRLEASQSLLIRAGRANPQPDEVTSAEQAMERGASESQIVATVKNPPANVSVAAALEALAQPGTPGKSASAGEVGAAVSAAAGAGNAAGNAAAGATGHVGVGGVAAGATGAVGAVVGPKKP
ncbi:MAG TPA: hypothetical protein VH277_20125 [Gemmatimonadaceae bacterium]|jgi:hypothetical protein|nr:hypothetical protein [Gemmatimonadaceae bacterium]